MLEEHASGAEARVDFVAFMPGLKSRPTSPDLPPESSFSAACKPVRFLTLRHD
jgi:hypothetical protein